MKNEFENILLVDDDQVCITIASAIIKHSPYRKPVHVVYNGKQALEFLIDKCLEQIQQNFCPALVLLDLDMPIMNGFEFLEAFVVHERLQKAGVTIIILTSSLNWDDKDKIAAYPIAGYIEKPITELKIKAILG